MLNAAIYALLNLEIFAKQPMNRPKPSKNNKQRE
jgi:hypothetical protein